MDSPFEIRFNDILGRFGRRRAVVRADTGAETTFDDIARAARELSDTPAFAGLAGRIVLMRLPNSREWPVAFLALRRAGAIVVPADADTTDVGLREIAARLRAVAVYDTAGLAPTGLRDRAREKELFLGKLTSGSTGAPKAHFFTEHEMLADGDAVCTAMGIGPDDLNHSGLPFGHSYALGNLILPLFTHGVPMSVAGSHFPGVIAEEIARRGATVLPTVPALVSALHRADIDPAKLASLRLVVSAGARLDPEDARAFDKKFGVRVRNFYGSSETGGVAFDATGDDTLSGASVGMPLPGVTISRIRGGRLLVSGPAVRTRDNRLRRDGFGAQTMADVGHIDAAGRVILEGRLASLVKIGGRRINPAEIERALRAVPGVRDAFVCTVPGPGGEPRLAAVVAGDGPDPRALRTALREKLPAWKTPSRIAVVATFPLTARGKPDRAALLRLAGDE